MKKYFVMWTKGNETQGKHIMANSEEEAIEKMKVPSGATHWVYKVNENVIHGAIRTECEEAEKASNALSKGVQSHLVNILIKELEKNE